MANNATVSEDWQQICHRERNTLLRWVRDEGLDIISAHYIPNLRTVALKPWARRGGAGVFINHEASRTSNDCYVCEIPPGGKLAPQRQLYEEMILALDGRDRRLSGTTPAIASASSGRRAPCLRSAQHLHQHFNGSGTHPARFVAVTNCPSVLNPMTTSHSSSTRRTIQESLCRRAGLFQPPRRAERISADDEFVPDAVNLPLISAKERGAGGGHIRFNMARAPLRATSRNSRSAPTRRRNAHGPGAHVIVLQRRGLLPDVAGRRPAAPLRLANRDHDRAPNAWFHQHFNTGPTPARYLAFKHATPRNAQGVPMSWISGAWGMQIDYADEEPEIRRMFVEALSKHGLKPRMDDVYAAEIATLPPQAA